MSFNNEAGEVAYLISIKWLEKYEKYVLLDKFEYSFN